MPRGGLLLRSTKAACVLASCWLLAISSAHADDADMQTIYRVKGRDGRMTFTNIVEQVPVELRETSRVDLSHVALNTEVGTEINRRLTQRHQELAQSSYCQDLKDAVARGMLAQAWDGHAMTFVAACVSLLMLIVLPGSVRRSGASFPWRALSVLVPLGFLGVLIVRGVEDARGGFTLLQDKAKPCLKESFAQLDKSEAPLPKKVELLDKLEREALRAGTLGMFAKPEQ